jgi:membrane peptidoglycan carboxypeptidase
MGFRKTAAGKTGTTNDKRDAWFIGFTPQTLALTWVGFDDNDPTGLSGSDAAVPMWARYMNAATAGEPDSEFPIPPGISFAEIDRTTGGLVTPYCPRNVVIREAFKSGTEPSNTCPQHVPAPAPVMVPMYDEYGNLIMVPSTSTALTTDTTGTYVPPVMPPVAPDATLTGGIFRPEEPGLPEEEPVTPPPANTTTLSPPTSTDTSPPEDEGGNGP